MIRYDAQSGGKKIKIYKDTDGKCNGDGIISFQKQESVTIALDMLNNGYLR
jgi:RNA recognition motif-containing protein